MTEIKNSVTLTIPAGAEDYAKTIWAAIAQDARREARHWIAKQIEEQTDPVVAEPTEWGSVVRARRVGYGSEDTTTLRWQRHNKLGDAWISEPAGDLGIVYHSDWMYLVDPEVLRVGIREPGVDRDAAYAIGREDFAYDIRKQLTDLRSTIITGPEKRIADAALALVAALLGES